jgi:hypothetical protein
MALSSAQFAHNHEGGCVVRPALPDVGALSLFTHRVEIQCLYDLLGLKVLRGARCAHLEP